MGERGTSPIDTVKILIQHKTIPNAAAADSGWIYADSYYDFVVEADDGSAVKWGATNTADELNPAYYDGYVTARITAEDTRGNPTRHVFFWFDTSDIPAGYKIDSSYLLVNTQKATTLNFSSGGYMAARADTVGADYGMLLNAANGDTVDSSDLCFLDLSQTELRRDNYTLWEPTLAARDDCHDFGPRGEEYNPGWDVAAGNAMNLDVTAAVQAVVDAGQQARGIIFYVYFTGTASNQYALMCGDNASNVTKGNPTLTIHASSKRGPKDWDKTTVPIIFGADDGFNEHMWMAEFMTDAGYPFAEYAPYSGYDGGAPEFTLVQRDSMINNPLVSFVMHSKTHQGLGIISGNELNYELARDWMHIEGVFTDEPDTTILLDMSWPGRPTQDETYSITAISAMIDNGYQSSRAVSNVWAPKAGEMTYAGLDNYVNLYTVQATIVDGIFGDVGDGWSEATIIENLTDYIDKCGTDHGRAPLIIYAHSPTYDDCTWSNLQAVIAKVESMANVDFMSYRGMIEWRMRGCPFLAPSAVTVANGASATNETSAAFYDSVYTADSDANMLKVWIGPK